MTNLVGLLDWNATSYTVSTHHERRAAPRAVALQHLYIELASIQ